MSSNKVVIFSVGYTHFMFDTRHDEEISAFAQLIVHHGVEVDYNKVVKEDPVDVRIEYIKTPNETATLRRQLDNMQDLYSITSKEKQEKENTIKQLEDRIKLLESQILPPLYE